jgi:hypothetical protein
MPKFDVKANEAKEREPIEFKEFNLQTEKRLHMEPKTKE